MVLFGMNTERNYFNISSGEKQSSNVERLLLHSQVQINTIQFS